MCEVKQPHSSLFFWIEEVAATGAVAFLYSNLHSAKLLCLMPLDLDRKTVGELHGRLNTHTQCTVCVRVNILSDPACPLSTIYIVLFPSHRCNGSLRCLSGFMQHHSQTSPPHTSPTPPLPRRPLVLLKSLIHIYSPEELLYVSRPARETKAGLS